MSYYPKSQLKSNQYTAGGEYSLQQNSISSPQISYIGFYYETSNGDIFMGKNPQDGPNQRLFKLPPNQYLGEPTSKKDISILILTVPDKNDKIIDAYINLQNITNNNSRLIPPPNLTLPTKEDYKLGKFVRYFAKKNNENIYLEINKETHTLLKSQDTKIAWDLYTSLPVIWTLTGVEDKVYLTNKNIVALTEQQNKWYGFTQWFRDNFLKYYLAS